MSRLDLKHRKYDLRIYLMAEMEKNGDVQTRGAKSWDLNMLRFRMAFI